MPSASIGGILRSGRVSNAEVVFEVCLSIVVGHSQLICHTLLFQLSVYYLIVSATVETYLH